jgi:hypothetical protein
MCASKKRPKRLTRGAAPANEEPPAPLPPDRLPDPESVLWVKTFQPPSGVRQQIIRTNERDATDTDDDSDTGDTEKGTRPTRDGR